MKKAIFIGFLAIILMIPATVLTVGAAEGNPLVKYDDPMLTGEASENINYTQLRYYTITPCRSFDSRWWGATAKVTPGDWAFDNNFFCSNVPAAAKALMMNFTVTGMTGGGYISAWAYGDAFPGTSLLNYGSVSGLPAICNAVIVPVNASVVNEMVIRVTTTTHLICDVMGYFNY